MRWFGSSVEWICNNPGKVAVGGLVVAGTCFLGAYTLVYWGGGTLISTGGIALGSLGMMGLACAGLSGINSLGNSFASKKTNKKIDPEVQKKLNNINASKKIEAEVDEELQTNVEIVKAQEARLKELEITLNKYKSQITSLQEQINQAKMGHTKEVLDLQEQLTQVKSKLREKQTELNKEKQFRLSQSKDSIYPPATVQKRRRNDTPTPAKGYTLSSH